MRFSPSLPLALFVVLAAIVFAVSAAPAGDSTPGEPVLLDLEGVPGAVIRLHAGSLKPLKFRGPEGKYGWVTRIPGAPVPNAGNPAPRDVLPALAVERGRVYAGGGTTSTRIYALDAATGRTVWKKSLGDNGPSTVAVSRGRVVTNTESCTTYAFDSVTGKRFWSRWLGPSVRTAPGILGNRVITAYQNADSGYGLIAMDLAKGKRLWDVPIPQDIVSAPVCAGDRIYVTHTGGDVSCFDERGETVWRARLRATSAPFVGPGGLYVSTGIEMIRASLTDGRVIWRRNTVSISRSDTSGVCTVTRSILGPTIGLGDRPRPVVLGNRCCLASGRDLLVFDVGTGAESKRIRLPEGQTFASPPAILGERLLYATAEGLLVEIDPHLAAVRRAFDVGVRIDSQPVVADGRVHFTSGSLVLGMPWGPEEGPEYPQWGGGPSRTVSASAD